MRAFVWVALGGALGAAGRYGVYLCCARLLGSGFPYATLLVNVLGSLMMGLLIEAAALGWQLGQSGRLLLVVGVLGSFTTFSTFSLDFATLYRRGELLLAAGYVISSVSLSVGALFAGLALARRALG